MKRKLSLILAACMAVMLTSCRVHQPVEQASGSEDIAYLLFISPNEMAGKTVSVSISGIPQFEAKVVKAKKSNRKGTTYAIPVGRKKIKVTIGARVVYEKEIFVSSQETKTITLP